MKKRPRRDKTNGSYSDGRAGIAPRARGNARRRRWLVLLIGLVAVGSGCAYFNTFYNARAHFKKAERLAEAQRDLRRGEVATTTRGATSSSASREYDLTIEKCNKVIHNHGGSRWVDDAILLMGRAYLGKSQYREALNKFQTLVNDFPDSELHTEAVYFQGVTYYRLGREEEGRETFDALIKDHPKFKRKDEILTTQAEAYIEAGDIKSGTATLRRILREFDDRDRRVETLLRLGELYMTEGVFDSAYAAYEEIARAADKMTVRLDARERRADALTREGRHGDALAGYLEVLDLGTGLSSERVAPIKLKVAAVRVQLGDIEDALSDYELVREAYPNTPHAAEAIFETGRIYELYIGEYGRAIESYDALNELRGAASQSLFVTQARARSEKLKRLVELGITGSNVAAEGETEAEAMFLLAEQFLFQEGDTTRSWSKYHAVATLYADSPFGALARYGLAWIALRRDAEAESTMVRLVDVLVEYPGTPQAVQVGDILNARGRGDLIPEGALEQAAADSVGEASDDLIPMNADAAVDPISPGFSADSTASVGRLPAPVDSLSRETRRPTPALPDSARRESVPDPASRVLDPES